jgi:hypothetical protein
LPSPDGLRREVGLAGPTFVSENETLDGAAVTA